MRRERVLASVAAAACLAFFHAALAKESYQIGTPATPEQIAGWNIDVAPDGKGLPAGRGTVAEGETLFASTCAACHGAKGEGGAQDRLVGGQGTLTSAKPVKTVGSYWPFATTLFDYVRRAMPLTAPQSLGPDQVYALTAYLLFLNGVVPHDAELDAATLPKVVMPNRNGFVSTVLPSQPAAKP